MQDVFVQIASQDMSAWQYSTWQNPWEKDGVPHGMMSAGKQLPAPVPLTVVEPPCPLVPGGPPEPLGAVPAPAPLEPSTTTFPPQAMTSEVMVTTVR
jgi:hypothetical protein